MVWSYPTYLTTLVIARLSTLMGKRGLTLHSSLNLLHRLKDHTESIINVLTGTVLLKRIDDAEGTVYQCSGILHHIDVSEDEACLGTLGVMASLEGAD